MHTSVSADKDCGTWPICRQPPQFLQRSVVFLASWSSWQGRHWPALGSGKVLLLMQTVARDWGLVKARLRFFFLAMFPDWWSQNPLKSRREVYLFHKREHPDGERTRTSEPTWRKFWCSNIFGSTGARNNTCIACSGSALYNSRAWHSHPTHCRFVYLQIWHAADSKVPQ